MSKYICAGLVLGLVFAFVLGIATGLRMAEDRTERVDLICGGFACPKTQVYSTPYHAGSMVKVPIRPYGDAPRPRLEWR